MSDRVYATIDKTGWGQGPWQHEPDKVQWKDEPTGLDCLAVRGPGGHWCGYVGVPEGHALHGVDYDDAYRVAAKAKGIDPDRWYEHDLLGVHGGLTFAAHCADGPEETSICHVPAPGEPDHVWWLGFDCAHSGDTSPKYDAEYGGAFRGHYRTLDYVRAEVTSLARQIAEVVA